MRGMVLENDRFVLAADAAHFLGLERASLAEVAQLPPGYGSFWGCRDL
jgi:hypothetical protein